MTPRHVTSICLFASALIAGLPAPASDALDSWTTRNSGTANLLADIAYANGTFAAVGFSGTLLTSSNGVNWTSRNPGVTNNLAGITFVGGKWVVSGFGGTILTSTNLVSWAKQTSGNTNDLTRNTFGNGTYVVVGNLGTILTSTNATNWTSRTSGTSNDLPGVAYGNGTFVVVGRGGVILSSTNATTWTARSSGTANDLPGVTYGNGMFVVSGDSGTILTSPDGIAWTSQSSGTTHELSGIAFGNGVFVAVGAAGGPNGIVDTSFDAINWTIRYSGTNAFLRARLGAGSFVAVGANGSILQSGDTSLVFTNLTLRPDRMIQVQLPTLIGQSYTIQDSADLVNWTNVGSFANVTTNLLTLVDPRPVTNSTRLFYRTKLGLVPSYSVYFLEFAFAGGFQSGFTPVVSFPVSLNQYSANFDVTGDTGLPPATNVFFTGPAGSGLSATPADPNNSNINSSDATYQSPEISNPAAAPGGTWTVNYKGSNHVFSVPDPQAASRLVIPVPTASVSGGVLQSVSWVYKNASTGATLSSPPSYMTQIQLQIDGQVGGRIYNSPDLAPSITNHVLTSTVNWSNVNAMYLAYDDTLGNSYVISFSKP